MLARTRLLSFFALLTLSGLATAQSLEEILSASDGATYDEFGYEVALAADVGAVSSRVSDPTGSPDERAVYVYERGPSGWTEEARLTPGDAQLGIQYGHAIATNGTHIAVGARFAVNAAGDDEGAVYIYERDAQGWNEVQKLDMPDPGGASNFGCALAMDANCLIIGAQRESSSTPGAGAVYAFELALGVWTQVQKLTVAGGFLEYAGFGASVALSGDELIATRLSESATSNHVRSVYIFERILGTWTEVAKLDPPDPLQSGGFGDAVDIDAGWAVVGAPNMQFGGSASGAAYIFRSVAGVWSTGSGALRPPLPEEIDRIGESVAISGSQVYVGAPGRDSVRCGGPFCGGGAVFGFALSGGQWRMNIRHLPTGGLQYTDELGRSMSLDGDTLLVGRPGMTTSTGGAEVLHAPSYARPYGFCGAASPCENEDAYAGCLNGYGSGALLTANGSSSVTADNLRLTASGIPANEFGLFFMGAGEGAGAPFGDGQLLVTAGGVGLFRYPVRNSGTNGVIEEGPGVVAHTVASFQSSGHIASGGAWNFQCWYRDPSGPCASSFNLTNAVEVTFRP